MSCGRSEPWSDFNGRYGLKSPLRGTRDGTADPLVLFHVDGAGALRRTRVDAESIESLDLHQWPYGAIALPRATSDGQALIVFKQPGVDGRNDVLIVDKPSELDVRGDIIGEMSDGQRSWPGRTRLRVTMRQIPNDAGALPANVAVLRVATQLPCGVPLGNRIRTSLASVRYTVRAGDRAGWFEYAPDAVSHLEFAHGFPDIATREQGPAGIRGPSHLVVGLQRGIATPLLRPRSRPHRTARRAIYELHVGTFTQDGHFAAAASRLAYLRRLGFTTIQLMPIDVTSGAPGWSYDQTRTGAVDAEAYGGAAGLIAFVERAHALGLEVIIDKQYNHRGPEQDSRGELIEGMFTRATKWGPGLIGKRSAVLLPNREADWRRARGTGHCTSVPTGSGWMPQIVCRGNCTRTWRGSVPNWPPRPASRCTCSASTPSPRSRLDAVCRRDVNTRINRVDC